MKNNSNSQYLPAGRQGIGHNTIFDILIEFCVILLIVFTPLAYGAVQPWGIAVFEIIAALMAILWLFKMLKKGILEFVRVPINGFIALFISYVCLQLLFSRFWPPAFNPKLPTTIYTWATKTELLKIISFVLIFFVTLNTIKTKRQVTRILSVIITMGFIMSIFYLMRYFGTKAPRGIINNDHFSGYLGMIVPLALGFLFVRNTQYAIHNTHNAQPPAQPYFLLFFSVIVMGGALFFTMCRGGMFSFVIALLFIAILALTRKSIKKKGWILSAVAILIILTIVWLGATPIVERILNIKAEITSRYFGGRLPIWQGTLNLIKDYPLFGTGLGTFNYIFPKYQPAQIITRHYTYAHSDILELLSETGIIGFLFFVSCLLLLVAYLFRLFNSRHDPWVVGISIGLFGSLAAIFVHSFVDFNLHIPANAILLTLILAITLIVLHVKEDKFGERVIFKKKYFKFFNISPVTENIPQQVLREIFRISLYPVVLAVFGLYIFIAIRPALADYYFQRADLTKTKNLTSSIRYLKSSIKLDPANAKYHYELARIYSKKLTQLPTELTNALNEYKKAVELNPTNSKYHQSLAWTYGILADLNMHNTQYTIQTANLANTHFQQAISLETNNSYRYRTYAIWLFNHPTGENIKRGVVEYRKSIELEPGLAEEAFELHYRFTGDYNSLERMIPHTADGYLLLAEYLDKNDLKAKSTQLREKAISMLTTSLESSDLKEKAQIHMKLASVYRSLGESDKAINEYQKTIKIDSRNFWAHYWIGVIRREQCNYEISIRNLKKAMEIDPQNSWPYFELARIYETIGNISQAKIMWQTILNLKSPSPDAERIARRELKKYEKTYDNR